MDCINNAINAINKGVGNITLLHKNTNQLIRKLETVECVTFIINVLLKIN